MAEGVDHGCRSEICVDIASVGTGIHTNEGTVDRDLLVPPPQATVLGSTNCIVCPDEGNCVPLSEFNDRKLRLDCFRSFPSPLAEVEERLVTVDELMEANEVFTTGTTVSVVAVGSITYNGQRTEYKIGDGLVSQQLYKTLVGIYLGKIEDKRNWVVELE
ncbi:hypothetical protein L1887_08332 [Cichorium endivia]|nr:hypothetical protein L1887_08332 [Cichorium endivia]